MKNPFESNAAVQLSQPALPEQEEVSGIYEVRHGLEFLPCEPAEIKLAHDLLAEYGGKNKADNLFQHLVAEDLSPDVIMTNVNTLAFARLFIKFYNTYSPELFERTCKELNGYEIHTFVGYAINYDFDKLTIEGLGKLQDFKLSVRMICDLAMLEIPESFEKKQDHVIRAMVGPEGTMVNPEVRVTKDLIRAKFPETAELLLPSNMGPWEIFRPERQTTPILPRCHNALCLLRRQFA